MTRAMVESWVVATSVGLRFAMRPTPRGFGGRQSQSMLWKRVALGVVVAVIFSGLLSVLVRYGLVQAFGKQVDSPLYGRRLLEHRCILDEKARSRVRRGTLLFFLVATALIFACAWSTILSPEYFEGL